MDAIDLIAGIFAVSAVVVAGEFWQSKRARRPDVMPSNCGRYLFDFWDDQRGFYVVFTPVDGRYTETRGPFRDRLAAMRALMWLACEHGFAEAPVIEKVGRGDD